MGNEHKAEAYRSTFSGVPEDIRIRRITCMTMKIDLKRLIPIILSAAVLSGAFSAAFAADKLNFISIKLEALQSETLIFDLP